MQKEETKADVVEDDDFEFECPTSKQLVCDICGKEQTVSFGANKVICGQCNFNLDPQVIDLREQITALTEAKEKAEKEVSLSVLRLEDAEDRLQKNIRQLVFAGLLRENIHLYPDLKTVVAEVFAKLKIESCELCLHPKPDHFETDGTPNHCCDGCNGFTSKLTTAESCAELYNDLLMAVATKCPNETRHESVLRYIREAEANKGNGTARGEGKDNL